jgi:hypothetical protein
MGEGVVGGGAAVPGVMGAVSDPEGSFGAPGTSVGGVVTVPPGGIIGGPPPGACE